MLRRAPSIDRQFTAMHTRTEQFSNSPADPPVPIVVPGASSSLTYETFYGLREKPFSLSADPRFLFRSPAHGPASTRSWPEYDAAKGSSS